MHLAVAEFGTGCGTDDGTVLHVAGCNDLENQGDRCIVGHLMLDDHALVLAGHRIIAVTQLGSCLAQELDEHELVGFGVAGDDLHHGRTVRVLYFGGVGVGRVGDAVLRQVADELESGVELAFRIGGQCGADGCRVRVAADLELAERHVCGIVLRCCFISHD